MRFVPIKTDDQLDLQSLHRVRERWVMRRTAVIILDTTVFGCTAIGVDKMPCKGTTPRNGSPARANSRTTQPPIQDPMAATRSALHYGRS
jgi:hypothetical protein